MWICIRLTHFIFTVRHWCFLCLCVHEEYVLYSLFIHPTLFLKTCIDKLTAVFWLFYDVNCWEENGEEELNVLHFWGMLQSGTQRSPLRQWEWCWDLPLTWASSILWSLQDHSFFLTVSLSLWYNTIFGTDVICMMWFEMCQYHDQQWKVYNVTVAMRCLEKERF